MARFIAHHLEIPVALLDRPWNRVIPRVSHNVSNLIVRCFNWDEILMTFPHARNYSKIDWGGDFGTEASVFNGG